MSAYAPASISVQLCPDLQGAPRGLSRYHPRTKITSKGREFGMRITSKGEVTIPADILRRA
jgi:hypothetical protein